MPFPFGGREIEYLINCSFHQDKTISRKNYLISFIFAILCIERNLLNTFMKYLEEKSDDNIELP